MERTTMEEQIIWEGQPAVLCQVSDLIASILTLGLYYLYCWWRSESWHYKVTTRRIVVEMGVLNKRTEQVELFRIKDYTIDRPFSQRLFGTGNLGFASSDKSSAFLAMNGIPVDVVILCDKIRMAVDDARQARGVVIAELE